MSATEEAVNNDIEFKDDVWKIGVFTDKVNEELTKNNKKTLHRNTIDNWFKQMEKMNIHFLGRAGKEKVYDKLDFLITLFITEKRDSGWQLEAAYNAVKDNFDTRLSPTEETEGSLPPSNIIMDEEFLRNLEGKLTAHITNEVARQVEPIKNQALLLEEDPEVRRRNRLEEYFTAEKVKNRLRDKARLEWGEKPLEERTITIRTGFFGLRTKIIENESMKNQFVEKYIAKHYEEELYKEFDMEPEAKLAKR